MHISKGYRLIVISADPPRLHFDSVDFGENSGNYLDSSGHTLKIQT